MLVGTSPQSCLHFKVCRTIIFLLLLRHDGGNLRNRFTNTDKDSGGGGGVDLLYLTQLSVAKILFGHLVSALAGFPETNDFTCSPSPGN